MIYADHAATTKMSAEAMAAMVKGWEVYGNPSRNLFYFRRQRSRQSGTSFRCSHWQTERAHAHYLHSI